MSGNLSRILEKIGTALVAWARSSSSQEPEPENRMGPHGVRVTKDDILCFHPDIPETDLPLAELRLIIRKASKRAGEIFELMESIRRGSRSAPGVVVEQRQWTAAARKSVTIRDSLDQVAKLLSGEVLEPPKKREFEKYGPLDEAYAYQRAVNKLVDVSTAPNVLMEAVQPSPNEEATTGEAMADKEAREAAIKKASEQVRAGGWLKRAKDQDAKPSPNEDGRYERPIKTVMQVKDEFMLREAEIFEMIKKITDMLPGTGSTVIQTDVIRRNLQEILDYINPDQEPRDGR